MHLTALRKPGLGLAMFILMALSTACIRADMGVSVKDDGSGTITLTQAMDVKAFQDAMKQFEGLGGGTTTSSSPSEIFSENDVDKSKLPPGSKVEKYKDGNYEGLKVTTSFEKPEDILPTLNRVADAMEGVGDLGSLGGTGSSSSRPGATPTPSRSSSSSSASVTDAFDKFELAKTSTGWRFEAVASNVSEGVEDQMGQALMAMILKDAQVTFSLRLPGRVTQTNADSNKDGELKWNLPLASSQPKTMNAVTTGFNGGAALGGDGGGFPILIVLLVVGAIVAVGGLYYWSKQRQAAPRPPAAPTA